MDQEFKHDFYICPDIPEIEVHNNPSTFVQGYGVNFNLVINSCSDAQHIDEKYGLSTYNSNYDNCQDADQPNYDKATYDRAISKMIFRSKVMSQDAGTPMNFKETGDTNTFFTIRT